MKSGNLTAHHAGLAGCPDCHLLCRRPPDHTRGFCPRCGARLHSRKPESVGRTWALLLAAAVLYIPANVLPITRISTLTGVQNDTILSGVVYFITTGMWPIALIIFTASVCVPLLKVAVLSYLLISVRMKSTWHPRDRTRLYRLIEAVGRWSMVDIFVVTVLVALVNVGAMATVKAGPAAPFFAAVVVLTMFATKTFDPRLIWDVEDNVHD